MKNKRPLLALIWLLLMPALACTTLTGGDESTTVSEQPTALPEAVTAEVATAVPPTELAPTATTDAAAGFVPYDNADVGLAFSHPADWAVDDTLFFFLTVASSQALLSGDTADIEDGAVMVLLPGSTEEFGGSDPVALLDTAAEDFALGTNQVEPSTPEATTIQDQPAAVATLSGTSDNGTELEGQIAIIVNGEWAVIAFGVTPATSPDKDDYLNTLDAVMRTIVVSEPLVVEPDLPEVESPEEASEPVAIEIGGEQEEVIPENGAVDYLVTLVRGETVTITADPEEELDLVLEILSPDDPGDPLRSADDAFSGETEVLIFAAPEDGNYLIRVRGFAGSGGGYVLTTSAGGAVNQTEGLIPMALQTRYEDELAGDPVGYLLSLTAGQPTPIILVPATEEQDLILEVFDLFGNQLERMDGGFSGEVEALIFEAEEDGDYEVRVSAFGANEDGYTLMAFDPSLAFQAEDEVTEDAEAQYRMCVPAGASLLAVALPEEGFDLTLTLFGPEGEDLTDEIDDAFSGEAEVVYYTEAGSAAEPYPMLIQVAGWAGGGGRFTVLITSTGDTPVVEDGC